MPRAKGPRVREVFTQYDDGTEELTLPGFTSDEAAIKFAEELAHQHTGRHKAVRLGYKLPEDQRPAVAILVRGLSRYPHSRAFYPEVEDMFRELRLPVPKAPEVHDYRTGRGQRLREDHSRHPWDLPHVQALASRFNWPRP